jgi:D-arabinose 1-dehydrogenase-like Zn-dependent alcohol dehydrogenase
MYKRRMICGDYSGQSPHCGLIAAGRAVIKAWNRRISGDHDLREVGRYRCLEMLDFCGAHNITADVEVIPVQRINETHMSTLG